MKERVKYVRGLPEGANDGLAVGPAQDQELVQHCSSETDAAPSRTLSADRGDEVGVAGVVLWERKAEEVAAGRVDIRVECDAGLGVGVGRGCLGGGKADEGEESGQLHCEERYSKVSDVSVQRKPVGV